MKVQYSRFIKVLFFIYCFVFVLAKGLSILEKNSSDEVISDFSLQGKKAPTQQALVNLDEAYDEYFLDYEDEDWPPVTIVNWWGSWCPPCREEFPLLKKWSTLWAQCESQSPGQCPVLIGVAFDDTAEDAQEMIDVFGLKYSNWIDMDGKSLVDWGVTGAPETFFIDSKGIVRAKIIGLLTEESLLENINLIMGEEN